MKYPFPTDSHFGEPGKEIDWRNMPSESDDDEHDDEWAPGYAERYAAMGVNWTDEDFEEGMLDD